MKGGLQEYHEDISESKSYPPNTNFLEWIMGSLRPFQMQCSGKWFHESVFVKWKFGCLKANKWFKIASFWYEKGTPKGLDYEATVKSDSTCENFVKWIKTRFKSSN